MHKEAKGAEGEFLCFASSLSCVQKNHMMAFYTEALSYTYRKLITSSVSSILIRALGLTGLEGLRVTRKCMEHLWIPQAPITARLKVWRVGQGRHRQQGLAARHWGE